MVVVGQEDYVMDVFFCNVVQQVGVFFSMMMVVVFVYGSGIQYLFVNVNQFEGCMVFCQSVDQLFQLFFFYDGGFVGFMVIWVLEVVVVQQKEVYIVVLKVGGDIVVCVWQFVGRIVLKQFEGFQGFVFVDKVVVRIIRLKVVVILNGIMMCRCQQGLQFRQVVGMGMLVENVGYGVLVCFLQIGVVVQLYYGIWVFFVDGFENFIVVFVVIVWLVVVWFIDVKVVVYSYIKGRWVSVVLLQWLGRKGQWVRVVYCFVIDFQFVFVVYFWFYFISNEVGGEGFGSVGLISSGIVLVFGIFCRLVVKLYFCCFGGLYLKQDFFYFIIVQYGAGLKQFCLCKGGQGGVQQQENGKECIFYFFFCVKIVDCR